MMSEYSDDSSDSIESSDDTKQEGLVPSLETHPYSLQCLIDWVRSIEENDTIIKLDFDKIEQDLQQLKAKHGNQCKGLFYMNKKTWKGSDIYRQLFADNDSIIHYIIYNQSYLFQLDRPDYGGRQAKLENIKKTNGDEMFKLNMKQSIYILRLLCFKHHH